MTKERASLLAGTILLARRLMPMRRSKKRPRRASITEQGALHMEAIHHLALLCDEDDRAHAADGARRASVTSVGTSSEGYRSLTSAALALITYNAGQLSRSADRSPS